MTGLVRAAAAGILLSLACSLLGAQAGEDGKTGRPVIVASLEFSIEGKTRESALRREIKIDVGMRFEDRPELEYSLDRDIQNLINLRIFSKVEPTLEYVAGDGPTDEAHILVTVADTWSLFPFIMPSSEGSSTVFNLAIVDKNIVGSLTELRLSGDFGIGTEPETGQFEIPRWGLYLDWSGVTLNQWQFSTHVQQIYETERKFSGDVMIEDYSYYETRFAVNIRYEFRFLRNLYYHIIPAVRGRYSYDVRRDSGDIEYEYFSLGLGQALDYQRIDWEGFFRHGWAMGILNFFWGSNNGTAGELKTDFTARISGYGIWGPVNPNARLLGYYAVNHESTGIAEWLRGVRNNVMFGNRALILNTGLQFRLFRISWLEAHLQPFFDAGIAARDNEPFNWADDIHLGLGSELILFFPTLPSVQIRGFVGFDLTVDDWSSQAKFESGLSFNLFY